MTEERSRDVGRRRLHRRSDAIFSTPSQNGTREERQVEPMNSSQEGGSAQCFVEHPICRSQTLRRVMNIANHLRLEDHSVARHRK